MKHDRKYEEDWEQDAPLLSSLRGNQPHEAPEGYFEALPGTIMDRIRASEASGEAAPRDPVPIDPIPGRSSFWNWRNIGLAAGMAILVGTALFFTSNSLSGEESPAENPMAALDMQLDLVSDSEIIEFIEFEDVDEEIVAEMMGDEALAAMEAEAFGQGGDEFIEDIEWEDLDLESLDLNDFENLDDFLDE